MGSGLIFAAIFIIVTAGIVSFTMFMKPRRKTPVQKHDRKASANDLEKSISMSYADPGRMGETHRLLRASRLLILGTLGDGKKLGLKHWEIEGRPVIPAFTSLVRLRESITNQEHYVEMDACTFLKSIPGNSDIMLNPNTQFSMELKHNEILKLLEPANHKSTEAQG